MVVLCWHSILMHLNDPLAVYREPEVQEVAEFNILNALLHLHVIRYLVHSRPSANLLLFLRIGLSGIGIRDSSRYTQLES